MAMDLEGLKRKLTEGYERINKMKNSISKIETCRTRLKAKGETTVEHITMMMDTIAQKLYQLQQLMESTVRGTVAERERQLDAKKSEIQDGYAKLVKVCVEADKVLRGRAEELLGRSCQRLFSKFEAANIKLDAAEKVDTEGLIAFEYQDNSKGFLSSDHVARLQHYDRFGRLTEIDEFWVDYPNTGKRNEMAYSILVPNLTDIPNNRPVTIRISPDRNASISPKQSLETIQEVPEDASPVKVDKADDISTLLSGLEVVHIREEDLCVNTCQLENCYQDIRSTDDSQNFVPPPPGFSKLKETYVEDSKIQYFVHQSNPAFSANPKLDADNKCQADTVQFTNGSNYRCKADSAVQFTNGTHQNLGADNKWQAQFNRTVQFTNGTNRKLNAHYKSQADRSVQVTNGSYPDRAALGKVSKSEINIAYGIPNGASSCAEYSCMNSSPASMQSSGGWPTVDSKVLIKSAERSRDDDDFIWDSDEGGDFPELESGPQAQNSKKCQNEKDWIKLNCYTSRKVPYLVNLEMGSLIKIKQEKTEQGEVPACPASDRNGHNKTLKSLSSDFEELACSVSNSCEQNKSDQIKYPACSVSSGNGLNNSAQSDKNAAYLMSNGNGLNKSAPSNENPACSVSNSSKLNKSAESSLLTVEKYSVSNSSGISKSAQSNKKPGCLVSEDSNGNGVSKSDESSSSTVGLNGHVSADSIWSKKEKCYSGQEGNKSSQETKDATEKAAVVIKTEGDTKRAAKQANQVDIKLVVNPAEMRKEQKEVSRKVMEISRPIKTRSKRLDLSHMLQHTGGGVMEIHAKCIEKIRGDFDHPIGVCTNSKGDVIVADTKNHIIKVCNNGRIINKIGGNLRMHRPSAVAVNEKDEIFVKDDNCLYHFDAKGRFIKKMGNRMMNAPYGLGMSNEGKLVVVDAMYGNGRIHIVEQDGAIDTYPYQPLRGRLEDSKCRFLAVHGDNVLTSDLGRSCLYLTNQKGELKSTVGHWGKRLGELHEPAGIATDSVGNWVVADSKNHRLQVFAQNGYLMAALHFIGESIRRPSGIHLTSDGLLYIINYWDAVIKVFKLGAS